MNALHDQGEEFGASLRASLSESDEGEATVRTIFGTEYRVFEPVIIGKDFVRFTVARTPDSRSVTIPFSSIDAVTYP